VDQRLPRYPVQGLRVTRCIVFLEHGISLMEIISSRKKRISNSKRPLKNPPLILRQAQGERRDYEFLDYYRNVDASFVSLGLFR
jgi:hypothetical protein